MSTEFAVRNTEGKEVSIARRVGTAGGVRINWLNDLADLVHDDATVIAIDNTQQGVETMKDLRELDKEDSLMTLEGALDDKETDLQEAISNMQECKDHIRKLRDELEDLESRKDFWREQAEGLETEVDFWKSQANRAENERMSETQIATREKEVNDELQQSRKDLSNALQESLDREAALRAKHRDLQEVHANLEKVCADLEEDKFFLNGDVNDSLGGLENALVREEKLKEDLKRIFDDYVEARELVMGESSLHEHTHGEFLGSVEYLLGLNGSLEVMSMEWEGTKNDLKDALDREEKLKEEVSGLTEALDEYKEDLCHTVQVRDMLREDVQELKDELEIVTRREQHFLECLKESQQESLDLVRENRKFERDLREARWDVVETKNFTVTFFNETFEDGRGGCFEHNTRGEDVSGGLWFGTDFNGELRLRDYDGLFMLPHEVRDAVSEKGYSVANTISTDADQ